MALPDRPLSRKEEYLAKIAGQEGVQKPDRPLSRTEEYLDYIAENGGGAVESYDSTAEFPAEGEEGKIYIATDTGNLYTWNGSAYVQVGGGGGSTPQIKTLTSADINYPIDEPTRISLALLPEGIYTTDGSVQVCLGKQTVQIQNMHAGEVAFVMPRNDGTTSTDIYLIRRAYGITTAIGNNSGGTVSNVRILPTQVIDDLTSVDTEAALSAAQGKVLKDTIDNRIRVESTAPTTSTSGALGQLWIDNTGPTIYILSNISGSTYTWTNLMA